MTYVMADDLYECPHCSTEFSDGHHSSRWGDIFTDGLSEDLFGSAPYTPFLCWGCGGVLWTHELGRVRSTYGLTTEETPPRPHAPEFFEYLDIANSLGTDRNLEILVRRLARWKANDKRRFEGDPSLERGECRNLEALLELLDDSNPQERVDKADVLRTLSRHDEAIDLVDDLSAFENHPDIEAELRIRRVLMHAASTTILPGSPGNELARRAEAILILAKKRMPSVFSVEKALHMRDTVVVPRACLTVRSDMLDKGIWVRFTDSESGVTYEYPHDDLVLELKGRNPDLFESRSWATGEYNWPSIRIWSKYSWIRDYWLHRYETSSPPQPESDAYLQAVRDWRNYWRPEKVRYLLIAESHVHEKERDSRAEVIPLHQYGLQDHPSAFCRLIYCLGYGELELLNRPVRTNYRGTPQFWDIFGALSCCDVDHPESRQPRKGQSDLTERVRWKIKTLEALKEKGIWLIDACPKGLYVPGDDRQMISDAEFKRLFVEEVLPGIDTENLRSSWIIGKTVHDKIADVTPSLKGYIYQPQGWRRSQRKYRKHLQPMIDDICDETNEDTSDTSGEVEERDRSGTEYGSPLQGYE